jgi:hypothetical protein
MFASVKPIGVVEKLKGLVVRKSVGLGVVIGFIVLNELMPPTRSEAG